VSPRVALATCRALPEGDPDDRPLADALTAEGVEATWVVWDDPSADWAAFDLVLVRSPWDYTDRRDAFVAWARSVPRIANPADVLDWNTDKRYLADLMLAGLPVVPTRFVGPDDRLGPEALAGEVVVKPAVSAGARDTGRFTDPVAAWAHIRTLHERGALAMVQPYVPSVDDEGETGLVYLGGEFSHALRKGPILRGEGVAPLVDPVGGLPAAEAIYAGETISARTADSAQRAVADWVLLYVRERFGPLAYARIDLVTGPDGAPLLLEAELCEPSLYLGLAAGAHRRLARVVRAELD
jgi:hypothetical protein